MSEFCLFGWFLMVVIMLLFVLMRLMCVMLLMVGSCVRLFLNIGVG